MINNSKPLSTFTAALTMCAHCNWQVKERHLQRLLYLANMFYMGRNNGAPLIEDSFQAWHSGPVIPKLHEKIGYFRSRPVRDVFWHEEIANQEPERGYFDAVATGFLQGMPHNLILLIYRPGSGWDLTYDKKCPMTITPEAIMAEYNQYHANDDKTNVKKPLRLARESTNALG